MRHFFYRCIPRARWLVFDECQLTLGFYCSPPAMSTCKPVSREDYGAGLSGARTPLVRRLKVEPGPVSRQVFPHRAHFPHLPRDNPVDSHGRLFSIAVIIPARGAPHANYSSTYLDELQVLR